ncbi:Transcription factor HFR1 [Hirschfeldia incana]|nr:Transcription factor HFR1 [Hirschfeldia incana]
MGMRWRNDVESFAVKVKDQDISKRARSDDDCQTNGLKWSYQYHYFDHDQGDDHVQIVPDIRKEEDNSKKNLTTVVPDEHSETGDDHHHHIKDYSNSSYNRRYLRNKHAKRRVQMLSADKSEGFTRKVHLVTKKSFKRRRRDEMMSNRMRTLQQLVPNCHKTDKVSVLDKTIEYVKNLQFQLQVMLIMGMNPYIPQATLNFGMRNHLLTAMGIAQGLNPGTQTTLSPVLPASNWISPPFNNLSFPYLSNKSLFTTPVFSQCLCGLVPNLPSLFNFTSNTMGGRL